MDTRESDFVAELIVARDVRASGDDARRYRRDVERGRLVLVRRGVYLPVEIWGTMNRRQRSIAALWAHHLTAARPPVFTHESAALIHGLPLLGRTTARISVHAEPEYGGRSDGDIRRRPLRLSHDEVMLVEGLSTTTPARTVIDLAGALPFAEAVMAADHALHARKASSGELEIAAGSSAVRRAARKVGRVVSFADPLSESPGESLSRAVIHETGFPAPVLQAAFRDREGFIGRVDFWWPEHNLIGEFDGRIKYQAGRFAGTADEVVWKEKLREDRLRALGPKMARWIWSDTMAPSLLAYELSRHGLPTSQHGRADRTLS